MSSAETLSAQTLERRLGVHIANATTARKSLTNSIALSDAAVSVMVEALQTAETSLQSLTELRIRTEALIQQARTGALNQQQLKRKLGDYTFQSVNVRKDHESAVDDAWNGWRSAMANIVRAGKAEKDHESIIIDLQQLSVAYKSSKDVRGLRCAIEKENEQATVELKDYANGSQDTLRGALKRMNDHSTAWEWVDQGLRNAASATRSAIAEAEQKER